MTDLPKISIVTPSFNQGDYIEETIRSVIDQGYPNLEYIVIDGGSDDSSVDIIRKHEHHISYWESNTDRGQSHAINKGFARATGEIFAWLNSDDYLLEGALDSVADAFSQNVDVGAFVGHGAKVDRDGEIRYYKEPGELTFESFCGWMDGGNFMQPSCFFRRSAWEAAGPLNEDIHIALDVDLWLRMSQKVRFQKIDKLLSHALIHEEAKTTAQKNLMIVDCAMVIIRAGGEEYVRHRLDELANRLTEFEKAYERRSKMPIVRMIRPFWHWFRKRTEQ